MAKKLPDPLTRRHLLEKELGESQAVGTAEAYLADGRTVEAIDFLAKAGASERLQELRETAVAEGDAFLLRAVVRASREGATHAEWSALAAAADAAGKELYAADARRQLELDEE